MLPPDENYAKVDRTAVIITGIILGIICVVGIVVLSARPLVGDELHL